MGKIFNLRHWLTLPEAAQHLTLLLLEPVTVPDLLRLAHERRIVLSIHMVDGATAHIVRFKIYQAQLSTSSLAVANVRRFYCSNGSSWTEWVDALPGGDSTFDGGLEAETRSLSLFPGLYDLPMIGAEAIEVEREFQKLSGGPAVEHGYESGDGAFVLGHGNCYRLFSSDGTFQPSPGGSAFPSNWHFAIRRVNLESFERQIRTEVVSPVPELDPDADDYPELLHIALRAWEHARAGGVGTPKQRVQKFLQERYPRLQGGAREAIAQVANWQRSGGRPPRTDETGR